jgi:membrane-bound lytic murein transglycosylase B
MVLSLGLVLPKLNVDVQKPIEPLSFKSELRLDKNSPSLLVFDAKRPEIKVGKSRSQVQAEAKARALASGQTRAVTSGQVRLTTEEAHRLVQEAAMTAGIPENWKELAAIWQVETGKLAYGCVISKADGRATGPMQFMPGTFRAYKPYPTADICNAKDALVAAGNLLKRNGIAEGKVDKAIHTYNHSMAYVHKVKRIADGIN